MKIASFVLLVTVCAAQTPAPSSPLRFHVTLDAGAAAQPVSGRLLVFMSGAAEPREELSIGLIPGEVAVAALEFESIAPGETVEFDPDVKSYPQPFSKAKPGVYQLMALL